MHKVNAYGDTGIRVEFGNHISKEINKKIRGFCLLMENENIKGVREWIPSYTAVTLIYDPYLLSHGDLRRKVENLLEHLSDIELPPAEIIHIPVRYGGDDGEDLRFVAEHNQLTEEEVVSIHAGKPYLVYMMGFMPGFPYLGGMSGKIATPRLSKPRARIKAGTVGIAGEQTGIYPLESPGGWQLIGKTPVKIYEAGRKQPVLLKSGNYVQFYPVSEEEFEAIIRKVENGEYKPRTETYSDKEKNDGRDGNGITGGSEQ